MPFYQFNKFTGRLKESTNPQPFYPIAPKTLQRVDPPKMVYDSIKTKPVKVMTGSAKYSTVTPKFVQAFKKFQADLHFPVFIAGGKADKMLFGVTLLLIGISTTNSIMFAVRK